MPFLDHPLTHLNRCSFLVCLARSCSRASLYSSTAGGRLTSDIARWWWWCPVRETFTALRVDLRGCDFMVGRFVPDLTFFILSVLPSRSVPIVVMVRTRVDMWRPMSVLAFTSMPDMSHWKAQRSFSPSTTVEKQ